MISFDILSTEERLKKRLFLEASAGTGKTFTIEHLVVRLLVETPLQLDQIVVVTFTKAATRELKDRIRRTLEGAESYPYLEAISKEQRAKLKVARACFESAKIFTVHGFCAHLLSCFPLEAGASLQAEAWQEEEMQFEMRQFLRTQTALSPGQLRRLCASVQYDMGRLTQQLQAASKSALFPSASQLLEEVNRQLPPWFAVADEFAAIRASYKGIAPAVTEQIVELQEALTRGKLSEEVWNRWIAASHFCLESLDPAHLKVRAKTAISEKLKALRSVVWPRLEAAQNRRQIFAQMSAAWLAHRNLFTQHHEKILPDDLLKQVHIKLKEPAFRAAVQNNYHAVIVDEFQDTDPLQWDIIKTLFLDDPHKYAYLVGDPKQSIYAFRSADIYTFLEAAKSFEHAASLSRNFRTASGLLAPLNTLLTNSAWMDVPKWCASLPIPEAIAAHEGEGELIFMVAEGAKGRSSTFPTSAIEEEQLLPFIVEELQKHGTDAAILVKDRYQAARVKRFLDRWGIPTVVQRKPPLGLSPAIAWLEEVADSFLHDAGLRKFLLGPFVQLGMHELTPDRLCVEKLQRELLEPLWEKGFAAVFAKLHTFDHDDLLELVQRTAFATSPQALKKMLQEIREYELEDRTAAMSSRGVAIMTIHASKGLEFETVFALGLASRSPEQDVPEEVLTELDAEKMRQLYVALTRAKRRLYIPLVHQTPEPSYALGEGSPIELFVERTQPDLSVFKQEKLLGRQFKLKTCVAPALEERPRIIYKPVPLKTIQSFTSLAQEGPAMSKGTAEGLAPGAQTGAIVHQILEHFFNREGRLKEVVHAALAHSHLVGKEDEVETLLERALACTIDGIDFHTVLQTCPLQTEMEFCYATASGWMKGYIDLCFERAGKLYVVDWKTNLIEDTTHDVLQRVMEAHDYFLQGEIYAQAVKNYLAHFPHLTFGGVYFVFVRGPAIFPLLSAV